MARWAASTDGLQRELPTARPQPCAKRGKAAPQAADAQTLRLMDTEPAAKRRTAPTEQHRSTGKAHASAPAEARVSLAASLKTHQRSKRQPKGSDEDRPQAI